MSGTNRVIKMKHLKIISYLLIYTISISCTEKKSIEVTENDITSVKSMDFNEIGRNPQEIVHSLNGICNYKKLLEFINDRGNKNNRLARKLDFNTFELIEDIWTKNHLRVNLRYIVHNNEITYGKIESIDSNYIKIFGQYEFTNNKDFVKNYVKKHNELYCANKVSANFYEEIVAKNNKLQIACGLNEDFYGESELKLFDAINKKNFQYLLDLIKSMNLEEQALGLIGMEKFIKKDTIMDQKIIQIVDHLKSKNSTIFGCITCVSGDFKLEDFLNSIDWSMIETKIKKASTKQTLSKLQYDN